jgi:hypothetical protein
VLAKLPQWKGTSTWAGDVYGLSAIDVTSLSPATGKAIAASNSPAKAAIDEIAREIWPSLTTRRWYWPDW